MSPLEATPVRIGLFSLRREYRISGEAASRAFLLGHLQASGTGPVVVDLDDASRGRGGLDAWLHFLLRPFQLFRKSAQHQGPLLIKIPTLGSLWLAKLLTTAHRGPRVFWLEGLCFRVPAWGHFIRLLLREPILTLGRAAMNTRGLGRLAIRGQDTFVVSSLAQQEEIHAIQQGCHVHIIENTLVDPPLPRPAPAGPPFRVGFLGHGYLVKGVWELIEALRILEARGIPFQAHLAFSDLASRGPAARARALGFTVSGLVEKAEFFGGIDLLVAPFWVDWGTNQFPNVLLESLHFGVPVLTTDLPSARDIFGSPSLAYLLAQPSPERLADALESIISHPETLPHPDELRGLFQARFSPDRVGSRWTQYLSSTLGIR